jgi:UDP-N-acetylmuramyl pentapeptide synthase
MTEVRRYEPNTKTLGEIAAFLGAEIKNSSDSIEISGVCSNSQEIEDGDLFIALPGEKSSLHPLWSVVRGRFSLTSQEANFPPFVILQSPC